MIVLKHMKGKDMIVFIYDDKNKKYKEFHVDSETAIAIETLLFKADYPSSESHGKIKFDDDEEE